MKNLIWLLVLILLSCTAKKVATKTEANLAISANLSDIKSDHTKSVVEIVGQSSDSTEIVTKTTTYDTSKPTNPVQSETVTTIKKGGRKAEVKKIETAKDIREALTDKSVNKSETKTEVKETPKPPAAKYYLWILVILVALAAGLFVYKKWAGIKNIYSRLITKS
jgi:hypothetical protein